MIRYLDAIVVFSVLTGLGPADAQAMICYYFNSLLSDGILEFHKVDVYRCSRAWMFQTSLIVAREIVDHAAMYREVS